MLTYQKFEANIATWARGRADIRLILVVGSRARRFPAADLYSDLDLILFSTDPTNYSTDSQWLTLFGELWVPLFKKTGQGQHEWLALYEGGLKGDFMIIQCRADALATEMLARFPYQDVFLRGFRILDNKTGTNLDPSPGPSSVSLGEAPSKQELDKTVNLALHSAAKSMKFALRADLWRAQHELNLELHNSLLTIIEWHTLVRYGPDRDTWYDGRFINDWIDPRVKPALPTTFARYNPADLQRAILVTVELMINLAIEIANSLDYSFPSDGQAKIIKQLKGGWHIQSND